MRRFLLACPVVILVGAVLGAAEDTPKAAATRKKLDKTISVNFNNTALGDVLEELKEKIGGIGVLPDTKGGVKLNTGITYKADDKPFKEVLDGLGDKYGLGYYVISQQGGGYDGALRITAGKERGYQEGQEPTATPTKKEPPQPEEKSKPTVKPKDKPKSGDTPKIDDPAKDEEDAARYLKLTREVIEAGKKERARDRLEDLIKRFPKTKAAEEARELLKKLDD